MARKYGLLDFTFDVIEHSMKESIKEQKRELKEKQREMKKNQYLKSIYLEPNLKSYEVRKKLRLGDTTTLTNIDDNEYRFENTRRKYIYNIKNGIVDVRGY